MLSPYVVIHAAPWPHDAVRMVSLGLYYDLYVFDYGQNKLTYSMGLY